MFAINIAMVGGIIVASSSFLGTLALHKPALSRKEVRYARGSILGIALLFHRGCLRLFPAGSFTFNFLANFTLGNGGLQHAYHSMTKIDTLNNIILGCGIAFELSPVPAYVLGRLDLSPPVSLKRYRNMPFVIIPHRCHHQFPQSDRSSQRS